MSIPDGDVIVHCGDASMGGGLLELMKFGKWFGGLAYDGHGFSETVFIPGNHDRIFETDQMLAREDMESQGVTVLIDEATTIGGFKFYGSPWQPRFFDWAFNLDRGPELAEKWAMIPNDTEVLITHGPPKGILDAVVRRAGAERGYPGTIENVGCEDLFERVKLLPDLKLHAFGHVHEGYGRDGIFVNASCLDGRYSKINPPTVVDL